LAELELRVVQQLLLLLGERAGLPRQAHQVPEEALLRVAALL
jgi:hypothetical protein